MVLYFRRLPGMRKQDISIKDTIMALEPKVIFNPDTKKAVWLTDVNKIIANSIYADIDSPYFLDPDMPQWDSDKTYSFGEYIVYGSGVYQSKVDNNIGNTPHFPHERKWERRATSAPNGFPGWNAYPPYGGPGRTPKFFSVTLSGFSFCELTDCSWLNKTFLLKYSGRRWKGDVIQDVWDGVGIKGVLLIYPNVIYPGLGGPNRIDIYIGTRPCCYAGVYGLIDDEEPTPLSHSMSNRNMCYCSHVETDVCTFRPATYEEVFSL